MYIHPLAFRNSPDAVFCNERSTAFRRDLVECNDARCRALVGAFER